MGMPNILSIAGSDPSGGAGIQADLKTIQALGGYGMAVITALTAQNTCGVQGVKFVDPDFVAKQINSIFDDIHVHAVKVGMAGTAESIKAMAESLSSYEGIIILDPVMVATSGDSLSADDSVDALKEYLIPIATMITPNIHEGEILSGLKFNGSFEDMAQSILDETNAKAIYLKGGHVPDMEQGIVTDYYTDGTESLFLREKYVETRNTHGTGCTLSSAIATKLALEPEGVRDALGKARRYLSGALLEADRLDVGHGNGPLFHAKSTA